MRRGLVLHSAVNTVGLASRQQLMLVRYFKQQNSCNSVIQTHAICNAEAPSGRGNHSRIQLSSDILFCKHTMSNQKFSLVLFCRSSRLLTPYSKRKVNVHHHHHKSLRRIDRQSGSRDHDCQGPQFVFSFT